MKNIVKKNLKESLRIYFKIDFLKSCAKLMVMSSPLLMFFVLSGCSMGGDSYIDKVKSGIMEFDGSITIGQAFDNYKECDNKEWEEFESDNGKNVVQFTCDNQHKKNMVEVTKDSKVAKSIVEANPEAFEIGEVKEIYQWTMNLDDTFRLTYSGLEWKWENGKTYIQKYQEGIEEVYSNEEEDIDGLPKLAREMVLKRLAETYRTIYTLYAK